MARLPDLVAFATTQKGIGRQRLIALSPQTYNLLVNVTADVTSLMRDWKDADFTDDISAPITLPVKAIFTTE